VRALPPSLLLCGLLWVDFALTLRLEWSYNAQYSYGWLVPFLALYLIYRRGAPEPDARSLPRPGWHVGLLAAGLLALLPLRVILAGNPEWRLALWSYTAVIFGLTLTLLHMGGGWRRVRALAPAFALFLFAVPWPTMIENPLTQGLMRFVASIVVECMNVAGLYAERAGNLIRLNNGWVGVEEACSGVRSFQSTIMAAWFVGELFRFPALRRAGLILLGGAASLALNVVRTMILTLLTRKGGQDLMERFHDPTGHVIAGVAFAALMGIAWFLRPRPAEASGDTRPAANPTAYPAHGAAKRFAVPAVALLWLAGAHAFAESWFRFRGERGLPELRQVRIDWSDARTEPEFPDIDPVIRNLLRYSDGTEARWESPERGMGWTVFFFTWDGDQISPFVNVHRPETCLPASGFERRANHPPLVVSAGGRRIEFSATTYGFQNRRIEVFYATWSNARHASRDAAASGWDRLRQTWRGERMKDRQSLQVVLRDAPDHATARRDVRAFVERTVEARP